VPSTTPRPVPAGAAEARARLLVLVHIPKAAGSTLEAILRYRYPGRAFDKGIKVFRRAELAGPYLEDAARRTDRRALSVEIPFGLAGRHLEGARFLTLVRDPVARVLSHFHYFKAGRGRGLVPPGLPPPPADLTIEEAVAEGGYIPDNLQTRMLCDLESAFDPLPPDALEQAKRNLAERFAFVGTTERFDELVALLTLDLGWPTLPYRRARVASARRHAGETARALRLVAERNALDAGLHAFAGELLDAAVGRAGPELQAELEVLREALRRLQRGDRGRDPRTLPPEARVEVALREAALERATWKAAKKLRAQRARIEALERAAREARGA
jgi:hypothetical protein